MIINIYNNKTGIIIKIDFNNIIEILLLYWY